ncbi:hypothetical protein PRIPAC_74671 [Pristionchus pacificus]|uniref:Uncharacterized protein n=1 Tax=Pristionchus pacificus TaxID=54126 RepID=A0A2A6BF03_PRIPA|nr:hypothetical protein PRIPAC_74671 [Pristionchus pacificus]|eukprot:PDM64462.1 hypothetical protein PRIPAC_52718 [Pristionchus pacificus]
MKSDSMTKRHSLGTIELHGQNLVNSSLSLSRATSAPLS